MPEIGLFPLTIVLLPTERIPLHIFEERYKELITECLATPREFGLVFATERGLSPVGTRAMVIELLDELDDGRMNIVVEGRERFRILELTSGRSFQTAEVEPFLDEDDPGDEDTRNRALELFDRVSALAGADVDEPDPELEPLSFAIAGRVDFPHAAKQSLLELRSERERLVELCGLLERAALTLAREREARERASGNGHVAPRTDG